jgi:hypothetical protein
MARELEVQRSLSKTGGSAGQDYPWIAIIVCVHVLFAWYLSVSLSPWQDEISTLVTTGSGLGRAFGRGIQFEQQAPGYFVLMAGFRKVFPSLAAVRLFSAACSAGTIIGAVYLVRTLAPWVSTIWTAAVVATNPILLLSAAEARVYAFAYLLSVVILLSFAHAYWHAGGSVKWRVIFAGSAALSLITQYYLGFLLPVLGIALLVTRRWRALGRMMLDLVPSIALMPIVLRWMSSMPNTVYTMSGTFPPPWRPFAVELETMALQLVDTNGVTHGPLYIVRQLHRGALWILGLASLFLRRRDIGLRKTILVPGIAGGAMVLGDIIATSVGAYWDSTHATCAVVPLALAPLALAYGVHRQLGMVAATLVCLSGGAACIRHGIFEHAKPCDPDGVAKALEQHATERDVVLIVPADAAWAVSPLYRGRANLVPVPGPVSFDEYVRVVPRNPQDIRDALERARPAANQFWLHNCNDLVPEVVGDFLRFGGWLENERITLPSRVELVHYVLPPQ